MRFLTLLACLLLSGCFAIIPLSHGKKGEPTTLLYSTGQQQPVSPKHIDSTTSANAINSCGPYTPPKRQPPPTVPVFTERDYNDNDRMRAKLEPYIQSLREYILQMHRDDEKAYQDYLNSCLAK